MYKKLIFAIPVVLLLSIGYMLFCYFSISQVRSMLIDYASYLRFYGVDLAYDSADVVGFPFSPRVDIKGFKLSLPDQVIKDDFTVSRLSLSYDVLGNWLVFGFPENKLELKDNGSNSSLSCVGKNGLNFALKFTKNPLLLRNINRSEGDTSVYDYFQALKYEDHGLRCTGSEAFERVSSDNNKMMIEIRHDSSEIDKFSAHFLMKISKYFERFSSGLQKNFPSVNIDVSGNFVVRNDSPYFTIAKIDDFEIQGDDFSLEVDGSIVDFSMVTGVFNGELKIEMDNYKKVVEFITENYLPETDPDRRSKIDALLFAAADKKDKDGNIKISVRQNPVGVTLFGNTEFAMFAKKIADLYSPTANSNIAQPKSTLDGKIDDKKSDAARP